MMEDLVQFDQQLFFLVNSEWTSPFFDSVFPWWRDKTTWIPLYIILVVGLIYKFKKYGLYLVLAAVIVVGAGDLISSRIIKPTVSRLRPCNDAAIHADARILVPCGSGKSFTSSHATNHFALAMFLILTVGRRRRWMATALFFWAFSIAYAQVYVGVHYPVDILGGAILGTLLAYIGAGIVNRTFWQKYQV